MSGCKGALAALSQSTWGERLLGNQVQILVYHGVSDDTPDDLTVRPTAFTDQMGWLANQGVQVTSLGDALDRLARRQWVKGQVVLTFDDGYTDFLDFVAPVLAGLGLPATVFVVTGKLGRRSDWNKDSRPRRTMTLSDLRDLREAGHTVGSHTVSHASLTCLSTLELEFELASSRRFLEDSLETSRLYLAYPYGAVDATVKRAVAAAGYECACGIGGYWGNGSRHDRLAMHRVVMRRGYSLSDFQSIVAGRFKRPLINWPLLLSSRYG